MPARCIVCLYQLCALVCACVAVVDWVCLHWTETDEGIWEVRGGQQHFVYSKVMAWVCLDRGIRLAERRSFPADLPRWLQVRNQIYEEIQEKGWNKKRKAFVQYYGSDTLDASVLVMPLVFFMSPTDPRFVSTLDAILASVADDGLVSNNLVFRSHTLTPHSTPQHIKSLPLSDSAPRTSERRRLSGCLFHFSLSPAVLRACWLCVCWQVQR